MNPVHPTSASNVSEAAPAKVVAVTACAANFYKYQVASLESIAGARARHGFDMVILDLGLEPQQIAELKSRFDCQVITPHWIFEPPKDLRTPLAMAYSVRPAVPQLVPGYDIYLWWDSDTWAQDDRFFDRYIQAAKRGNFAIARENDPSYRSDWKAMKWHYGNMVTGFGLSATLAMLQHPPVNEGIWAAPARHPIWSVWQTMYEAVVHRTGKANLEQHVIHLIAARRDVPVELVEPIYNWICTRSAPVHDAERDLLLSPSTGEPISVLHLAGPDKDRYYTLPRKQGGTTRRRLTWREHA
jgi:hypothetical protein